MTLKVMQMILRGFSIMLLILGLFYNSEVDDFNSINHFVTTGIFGSYIVITLGLMIEAGLGIQTDVYIESFFLGTGAFINTANSALAFYEYYTVATAQHETMNKGFVSLTCALIFLIDLFVLHSTK